MAPADRLTGGSGWLEELLGPRDLCDPEGRAGARLAEELLGAPLADHDVRTLLRRCGGHRTAAVELVLGGVEVGVLRWGGDRFRTEAPLPTHRLVLPVEGALAALPAPVAAALELLAWGEPLPEPVAVRLLPARVLRTLDVRGLVRLPSTASDGRWLGLPAPVLAEAIRDRTPPDRRHEHLERLAGAFERAGLAGSEPIRIARWHLDAGTGSAELLDRAARDAYAETDYELAVGLASGALERGAGFTAALARGAALGELGAIGPASQVLSEAAAMAPGGLEAAWSAIAHAHVLGIVGGRWDEAEAVLRDAAARAEAPVVAADVDGYAGFLLAARGSLPAAAAAVERVLDEPARSERASLLAAAGAALVALARGTPLPSVAADVGAVSEEALRALPLGADLVRCARLLLASSSGIEPAVDVEEAVQAHRRGIDPEDRERWALWSSVAGVLAVRCGNLDRGRSLLRDGLHLLQGGDGLRLRPVVAVELAIAAAEAGDPFEAERSLAIAEDDERTAARVGARCAVVRAWLAARREGPGAGARVAVRAGDRAAELGHLRSALDAWHLAVRLSRAELVGDRLEQVRAALPGPVPRIIAAHAAAAAAGDAAGLEQVAVSFATRHRHLLAAEAAAQAASAAADPRLRTLAATLRIQCPGAVTPALEDLPDVALTRRQLEVARLVREGCTDRDAAARLGISVRTVEAHLAAAYRKLGVRGRRQLAAVVTCDDRAARLVGAP